MSVTGTAGDILPLIAIGHRLARRGHRVTLLSHEPFGERAERAGVDFVPMDTAEEYQRLLDASASLVGRPYDVDVVQDAVGWYHTPQRREREFAAVVEHAGSGPAVVLARYVSNTTAIGAAEFVGAARGWSLVSPHALAEGVAIGALHGEHYRARLNRERAELGLPLVDDWLGWVTGVAVRMALWTDWFAPDTVDEPNSELVGFVGGDLGESGPLPPGLWEFLAAGDPPVLVTAGTGKMVAPGFHAAAVGGCLRTGRRVVLVGRYLPELPPWPAGLVHRLPEAPLVSLLPHTAAVIHHGGIGTAARALAAGVPQLVLAEGVDRPDNAQRLRRLGVAESLSAPLWTAGAVASALSRLDDPTVRQQATAYAQRMRTTDAAADAAGLVDRLLPTSVRVRPPMKVGGTDG